MILRILKNISPPVVIATICLFSICQVGYAQCDFEPSSFGLSMFGSPGTGSLINITTDEEIAVGGFNDYIVCSGVNVLFTGSGFHDFWLESEADMVLDGCSGFFNIFAVNNNTIDILDGSGGAGIYVSAGSVVNIYAGNYNIYVECGGEVNVLGGVFTNDIFYECVEDINDPDFAMNEIDHYTYCPEVSYTIPLVPGPIVDIGGYVEVNCDDYPYTLNASSVPGPYTWSTGESTSTIQVNEPGTYTCTVPSGCSTSSGSAILASPSSIAIDLGNSSDYCGISFPITLDAGPDYDTYLWNTGESTQTIAINDYGNYSVDGFSSCGDGSGQIEILGFGDFPPIDFNESATDCVSNFPLILDAGEFDTYLWNTGETTQTISVNEVGIYEVEVTNACGTANYAVDLTSTITPPSITFMDDTSFCNSQFPITLDATNVFDDYSWSTGESTSTISVPGPGTYSVVVSNACGTASDEITIGTLGDPPSVNLGPDASYCDGEFPITLDAGNDADSYLWSTGQVSQTITLSSPATVSVEVTNDCGTASDEITISTSGGAPIFDLGPDVNYCNADFPITLDAGSFDTYLWSTGEISQFISIDGPQTLNVTVTSICGTASGEITIGSLGNLPSVDLGPDVSYCDGDFPITLDAGTDANSYLWSTGQVSQSITLTSSTTLSVEVSNGCGTDSDEITISSLGSAPIIDLGEDLEFCNDDFPIILNAGSFDTYLWSNGEISQSISVEEPQNVSVTVTSTCGTASDEISVESLGNPPSVNLGANTSYCETEFPITLDAGSDADSYSWSTGEVSQSIILSEPATVSVEVTNDCGTSLDEITISSLGGAPFIDLGEDVAYCNADFPIEIDAGDFDSYIWSTGEVSRVILIESPQNLYVTVTSSCGSASDDLIVSSLGDAPSVNLGNNMALCEANFPITIDAGTNADSYLWSNGDTTQSIMLVAPESVSLEVGNVCGTAYDNIEIQLLEDEYEFLDNVICPGSSVNVYDMEFNEEGTYEVIQENGASNGCQLTSQVNIEIYPTENIIITDSVFPGDPYYFGGEFFFDEDVYTLPTTDEHGCDVEAIITLIHKENDVFVYVPNAFTSNSDGINELFKPSIYISPGIDVTFYDFQIYDRDGHLVYHSRDHEETSWNGTFIYNSEYYLPEGMYSWQLIFSTSKNSDRQIYKGVALMIH